MDREALQHLYENIHEDRTKGGKDIAFVSVEGETVLRAKKALKDLLDTRPETRAEPVLKPCPFCGGEARTVFVTGMTYAWWAGCEACGIHVKVGERFPGGSQEESEAKAEAVRRWNQRQPNQPDAVEARDDD